MKCGAYVVPQNFSLDFGAGMASLTEGGPKVRIEGALLTRKLVRERNRMRNRASLPRPRHRGLRWAQLFCRRNLEQGGFFYPE